MDIKKIADEEIKALIQERIKNIEDSKASVFFRQHPGYPETQKKQDRQFIIQSLRQIELIHQQILPYICNIKNI